MSAETFTLSWHTFSDHLREMLHEMMKSNKLTDVTLVCDDKRQFKAHKIVLSACSTIFKYIIDDLPQSNTVIYLKGIQHQEMESILEFMYLGVATFFEERISLFLDVAKTLEVKEINQNFDLNFGLDNSKFDEENIFENKADFKNESELISKPTATTTKLINENKTNSRQSEVNLPRQKKLGSLFCCDQCESQYTTKDHLKRHILTKHNGLRFPCNHCDYQAKQETNLKMHVESKHVGVRHFCDQCDFSATRQAYLKTHIQSKHEGFKYICNQCDCQLNSQQSLIDHKKRFNH